MNEINFNIENIETIDLSMDVGVKEIYPPIENLEVTPTKEQQVFNHENSYGYDKVTVKSIPNDYIIPKGTKDITTNGYHQVLDYEGVNVNVKDITNLQNKEVTPTKSVQKITSDNGFAGLNEVKVNPIPDEYIIPDGTLDITENGTKDVTSYAEVNVNIENPELKLQDKSITITENGTQKITPDEGYDGLNKLDVTVEIEGKEDLTEELNTYNTELTEQETIINSIIEALKNKTSNKEVE